MFMNFVKFLLSQHFFDILFLDIPHPYETYYFWKSLMRSFRWIKITCFNIFIFLSEVNTDLQKMHYFGQFRTITQKKKKETRQMTSFFSFIFFISNCLCYSCLYLKKIKIYFHGVLPLVLSGLQNTWIWR